MSSTVHMLSASAPRVIAAIALIAMSVELGLALEPTTDRAKKRHDHWLVARALAFNFVVVPCLALVAKRLLHADGPGAIALCLLAAAPGGRLAPGLTHAAGGDAALSVEITLFANKLNVFVSPWLAAWLIGGPRAELHELSFVAQLFVLQLVPYYGARRVRRWKPATAPRMARGAHHAASIAALVLFVDLAARGALSGVLSFGPRAWLAVLLFGVVLLALGWAVGGREASTRRTFAIASEARNGALALVIAHMTVNEDEVLLSILGAWVILLALAWLAVALVRGSAHHARLRPAIP